MVVDTRRSQSRQATDDERLGASVLATMDAGDHEQVTFCRDRETGLRSVIAIHDTTLGPALGGVRMWPYATERAALDDCLRLARSMTYKAAAAGVDLGGGKSVIIGDPRRDKSEALLRAHGRFIQTLGGRYVPGIDVGTEMADLEVIATEAERVSCVAGDPSPMTALGVLEGIRACLRATGRPDTLSGVRVCVQGAGHVGSALARLLAAEGAELTVADVDRARAARLADDLGAGVVGANDALSTECTILAPCALGEVIGDETLPDLRCEIVAGSANNVLARPEHAERLTERGILYAPDYCINAGGLIFLEEEMLGHDDARAERRVRGVGRIVERVIERSRRSRQTTVQAAAALAEERLHAMRRVGPPFVAAGTRRR